MATTADLTIKLSDDDVSHINIRRGETIDLQLYANSDGSSSDFADSTPVVYFPILGGGSAEPTYAFSTSMSDAGDPVNTFDIQYQEGEEWSFGFGSSVSATLKNSDGDTVFVDHGGNVGHNFGHYVPVSEKEFSLNLYSFDSDNNVEVQNLMIADEPLTVAGVGTSDTTYNLDNHGHSAMVLSDNDSELYAITIYGDRSI